MKSRGHNGGMEDSGGNILNNIFQQLITFKLTAIIQMLNTKLNMSRRRTGTTYVYSS